MCLNASEPVTPELTGAYGRTVPPYARVGTQALLCYNTKLVKNGITFSNGRQKMTIRKILGIILGVLMIASGIYCLLAPGLTYLNLGYVVGISMLMNAISRIVAWTELKKEDEADGWMLADAIISCIFAVVLLGSTVLQLAVDVAIAYMAAFWILVIGIMRIVHAFRLRRAGRGMDMALLAFGWAWRLCAGILMVIFGILGMMNPAIIMAAIGIFIGLGVITSGANLIIEMMAI